MSPFTTDKHNDWREYVRQFAEKEIKPIAAELDDNESFSVELAALMGQHGLYGIDIPTQYGGHGKDTISYIIAVEELARIDGSQAVTMAAHNSLGIAPIYSFGTEEQRKRYLPSLCSGEGLWAFGLTEANAGSDAKGVETKAEKTVTGWTLNGTKRYITNGSNALLKGLTVLAITGNNDGKDELSTIIIDRNTKGFETQRTTGKMMWRASDTAEIKLKDVKVPSNSLLGVQGKGLKNMLITLDSGRLSIAAMGLGLAQGAYEMALDYSKSRNQFGQAIHKFQSISFKLADMAMKIELARNTLYKACWLKDHQQPYSKEAAMAKLYCGQIAKEVADDAVQIFGGAGLFKSSDIERFYRDQRILQIGEGTSEILRIVIARHIGLS